MCSNSDTHLWVHAAHPTRVVKTCFAMTVVDVTLLWVGKNFVSGEKADILVNRWKGRMKEMRLRMRDLFEAFWISTLVRMVFQRSRTMSENRTQA